MARPPWNPPLRKERARMGQPAVFMGQLREMLTAMFTVYFDASGAPDQGTALSVAGFIAKAEQWVEFEKNWKAALQRYGVSELHMKEFAPGAGEFASWKEDKHKRQVFLERLINIIKTRVCHCFVNCIMLGHFQRVSQMYSLGQLWKPFPLAGSICIEKVKKWAKQRNVPFDQVLCVFEDGDKDKGELMRSCEKYHGFVPHFMKKAQSCAFQAADLLAYEHRLANQRIFKSGIGTLAMSDLRRSLQALDEIPHGLDQENWGVLDEEGLIKFCELNKYPKTGTGLLTPF